MRKARFSKFLFAWWVAISIAAAIFAPPEITPTTTKVLYLLLYLSYGGLYLNATLQEAAEKTKEREA